MTFVVPDVARFAVNQTLEGRAVVNVLDYQIDTTGSSMSRGDAIEAQASDIISAWIDWFLPWQVDDLTLDSVSFVDLNTADGTTGSIISDGTVTLPAPGEIITSPMAANTGALITKQAQSARGRRNGRMYLGGLGEDTTPSDNGNILGTTQRDGIQATANGFLAATNNTDGLGTAYESNLVVVHILTRGASTTPGQPGPPLTGDYSVVQALAVQQLLATQRRRLRG